MSFDELIFERGTRTVLGGWYQKVKTLLSNDQIQYRLPGQIHGYKGTFEIFTRPSISGRTELIVHRFLQATLVSAVMTSCATWRPTLRARVSPSKSSLTHRCQALVSCSTGFSLARS